MGLFHRKDKGGEYNYKVKASLEDVIDVFEKEGFFVCDDGTGFPLGENEKFDGNKTIHFMIHHCSSEGVLDLCIYWLEDENAIEKSKADAIIAKLERKSSGGSGSDKACTKRTHNFCRKCGAKLRVEDAFCPKCGSKIER